MPPRKKSTTASSQANPTAKRRGRPKMAVSNDIVFGNKLLLNQWLISLFGIDPLAERFKDKAKPRPFHALSRNIRGDGMEGLGADNLHLFYHNLTASLAPSPGCEMTKERVLTYEENIVSHTQSINEKRVRPVNWKYHQWLTLLFTEIYLDFYFNRRQELLERLNAYVARFNTVYPDAAVPAFEDDELNKVCLQNATGSGKTLLMHVNVLQYRHYAKQAGRENELSRIILVTPNESLSDQHMAELTESGISAVRFTASGPSLLTLASGLTRVDVLEITKLGDKPGPQMIATRSLGSENLLLVDEGHRGMSGKDEGVWFSRRAELCAKGFTIEYSATFAQAVAASGNKEIENAYAKSVLFDYSYRYFYEDGFGKDYHILNLPKDGKTFEFTYLTACLLTFYQQLRVYEDKKALLDDYNVEKPLWVFVGSTVTKAKGGKDEEKDVVTDVGKIISFLARFCSDTTLACQTIQSLVATSGTTTGLLDDKGQDLFANAFPCLAKDFAKSGPQALYSDIMHTLFNWRGGGHLTLCRVKGDSSEIALKLGASEEAFGLINVGDAAGLAKHVEDNLPGVTVTESDFSGAQFASVKLSSSPVNVLIGSKKFVEGWDCWRVSTMGLMHVGKSEGSQIIQLFGRGVRLKGWHYSLKRSAHVRPVERPANIEILETLQVFGVEADFMQKFREFLASEGLPGNERKEFISIPLSKTYDFGKGLKIVRPKRKKDSGREYDFKRDGPVPSLGKPEPAIERRPVESDWFPRIQAIKAPEAAGPGAVPVARTPSKLGPQHLALLDFDDLFFDLERYKRERSWHNFNITKGGIRTLLEKNTWYTLYLPQDKLAPKSWNDARLLQQVALELVKRYCDRLYDHCRKSYIEPRLELRALSASDPNLPQESEYTLVVDTSKANLISQIEELADAIVTGKALPTNGDIKASLCPPHLFTPLLYAGKNVNVSISPVALNEGEYQFVCDLAAWWEKNQKDLVARSIEIFLLRNLSLGKGVGFFEAGNFHPDFILWVLANGKQHVVFLDPKGLTHLGPGDPKIELAKTIKEIEKRLNDPNVALESFILSGTPRAQLNWGWKEEDFVQNHVLFMKDDTARYLNALFHTLGIQTLNKTMPQIA